MSIGNNEYNMYFFLCQDTVSLNWRFLTSPAARDSFVPWSFITSVQYDKAHKKQPGII